MSRRYRVLISLTLLFSTIMISFFFMEKAEFSIAEISNKTPIYRVKTEEKKISITFDINWAENDQLYNILEVLDKYNVKATFFIMGGWVNYSEENKNKCASSIATINCNGEHWNKDKIIYVRIRDKAGKRAGYFLGSDNFFIKTLYIVVFPVFGTQG